MSRNVLVMYSIEHENDNQDQEIINDYPNAFIVQITKQITCKHIRDIFPWDRVPNNNKTIRFGLKVNEQTFWLDLRDQEPVPFTTPSTISLKVS